MDLLFNRHSRQRDASQAGDAGHDPANTESAAASERNGQSSYTTFKSADRSSGIPSQTPMERFLAESYEDEPFTKGLMRTTTAGPPPTKAQIEDIIKEASRKYEEHRDRPDDQEQDLVAKAQSLQLASRRYSVAGSDRNVLIQPSRSNGPRDSKREGIRHTTTYDRDVSVLNFDPTLHRDASTDDRRKKRIHDDVNKVEADEAEHSGDDTEPFVDRDNIRRNLREPDSEESLVQPQIITTPVYVCTFNFLDCRFTTSDEKDWRQHNLGHFHGITPPRSIKCPICATNFGSDDGHTAWEGLMSHLAAHFRKGETLAISRPDFKLLRYLWLKRIIDNDEFKELNSKGTLSMRKTDPERFWVVDGLRHGQTARVTEGVREMAAIARSLGVDPDPTRYFSLGPEFVEFMTEELQQVKDLLEVIVVTGSEDRAYAAPSADYAENIWPELGKSVLLSLIEALEPLKEFQLSRAHPKLETLKDARLGKTLLISASFVMSSAPTGQIWIDLEAQGKRKEVSEFSEIITWLSTICRKPEPDRLLCSRAEWKIVSSGRRIYTRDTWKAPSGTGGRGRCWHNMFKGYVLAEGFPIPHRGSQSGVELPFDVMTLLGLVLYPINFGQGIILKGDNTALIPSIHYGDDDCVQWHYLEGDGAGGPLTWDRIKEHCGNIYPSKDFKLLQSKRTFVGYFPSANVHLGTRDSGFDKVDFSGAEFDDKTAFVLGNELVGQVGTSVMNFFTAQVSGKLMVHRTAHQRLRGIHDSILDKVRNSKDLPILLFDVKTKQGWLVPELSAVLHMALAWASYQHESDQVLSNMPFADARPDGGRAAYDAILQFANLLLPEHIKVGDHDGNQITTLQALAPFFSRVGQIKDQQLQRHACGIKENKDLVGYEFKEIASFEEHLHLRRSKVDVDRSGGWLRLVSCKPEMAVILCSHLEAPIQPSPNQHSCPLWQEVPTDQCYLTASISCLRQLAKRCGGEDTLRLYNDIYCIPSKKDLGPGVCGTRQWPCCNPLLELSKHPSKKALRYDDEGALIIGKAVPQQEEHSSLRVFLRSSSNEKSGKAQNGSLSILQSNHQTLNGTPNTSSPQQSAPSMVP